MYTARATKDNKDLNENEFDFQIAKRKPKENIIRETRVSLMRN